MNLSEAANRVIDLARKVREYYDTELPKRHPNYPLVGLEELRAFLATLPEEMIYRLILLMYLGRGDFAPDELAEYYESMKPPFGGPEHAVSQMMDQAPLADYLLDGLEELRKQNINADRMPLKKGKVRKK